MQTNINIQNFYKYSETLASGAQPTPEQIVALKADGFVVIVNISPISTKNALKDEANIVEQHHMYYVHFPVDCSNLRPLHFETFRGIMNGLVREKVFVHCGGNIKSSNLLHMYNVLENKMDENESLQTLLKIQKPEEKWFHYFQKMGMQGIGKQ